ncbi:MAG TPA: hypothetical protein VK631_19835 [Solirubrobacteraceae bacterium]|nr:hypothetical protein [Solirubrobacteraceae bacterium]
MLIHQSDTEYYCGEFVAGPLVLGGRRWWRISTKYYGTYPRLPVDSYIPWR